MSRKPAEPEAEATRLLLALHKGFLAGVVPVDLLRDVRRFLDRAADDPRGLVWDEEHFWPDGKAPR